MDYLFEITTNYLNTNGWLMLVTQVVIAGLGVPAIFMSQSKNHTARKYASLVALTAQPFWFTMAWLTGAWGVFIMSFFYTAAWARGVWNFWLKPYFEGRDKKQKDPLLDWLPNQEILSFRRADTGDDIFVYLQGGENKSLLDAHSLLDCLNRWADYGVQIGEPMEKVSLDLARVSTISERLSRVTTTNLLPDSIRYSDIRVIHSGNVVTVRANVGMLREAKVSLEELRYCPRLLLRKADGLAHPTRLVTVDYVPKGSSGLIPEASYVLVDGNIKDTA